MNRSERLKAIRELIKENKVTSQEELLDLLSKKGFMVTQSTVSRDMKDLKLSKVRNSLQEEFYTLGGKYSGNTYVDIQKVKTKFRENVISIDRANNILVIKTSPGEAQGVAATIDGANFKEILGTVGGDDTIICVIESDLSAEKIVKLFKEF
ncbi:MAG: arginine repressor [Actinobacteria bacterium]|nr:arginine repressor [Actinomycetota bacterium]